MESEGEEQGPQDVAQLNSPCARDSLRSGQVEAVVRVAQVSAGQTWRYSPNLSQEAGPVDLVESVLQVHGSL